MGQTSSRWWPRSSPYRSNFTTPAFYCTSRFFSLSLSVHKVVIRMRRTTVQPRAEIAVTHTRPTQVNYNIAALLFYGEMRLVPLDIYHTCRTRPTWLHTYWTVFTSRPESSTERLCNVYLPISQYAKRRTALSFAPSSCWSSNEPFVSQLAGCTLGDYTTCPDGNGHKQD